MSKLTRILFTICTFLLVFMVPWWAAAGVVLILLWWFAPYYEAVLIGLFLDGLYILDPALGVGFGFPFTFVFTLLLFASLYIKDRVRIHV